MLRMARWDEIPEFWGVQVSIHLKFQADFALLINWICCCGVCFWPSNPLGIHHQSFWWKEHQGAKGHSIEALSNETSGFFGDVNPSPNPNKSSRKLKPWNPPKKSKVTLKKKEKEKVVLCAGFLFLPFQNKTSKQLILGFGNWHIQQQQRPPTAPSHASPKARRLLKVGKACNVISPMERSHWGAQCEWSSFFAGVGWKPT